MIGRYFPGDSFVHRLDARVKTVLLIALLTGAMLCSGWSAYAPMVFLTLLVTFFGEVPFKTVFSSVKPLWWILLFTFLMHLFGSGGETLFAVGSFVATKEGMTNGFFMCLRLVLLIVMSSLLTFTTDPLELTDAMESLLSPFKKIGLPTHELAMMMTIAIRFVPTLIEETDKTMKAQASRGADFTEGSLAARVRSFLPVLVPLFIACFRRADELALAMDARCYPVGGEGRTRLRERRIKSGDFVAIAVVASLLVWIIFLRVTS